MANNDGVPHLTWEEIECRMEAARSDGDIFGTCIRDQDGQPGCYILIMPPDLGSHVMECVAIWVRDHGFDVLGSFGADHEHPNN
jgi:hypothetical protein